MVRLLVQYVPIVYSHLGDALIIAEICILL